MYNLMLVEDEPLIRERLSKDYAWEAMGFTVCAAAANGAQALALLDAAAPDVIMTDLVMPGMGGLELIDQLRSRGCPAKVVVLSGYADFEYVKAAMQLGVLDYLLKPLKQEAVEAVFSNLASVLDGSDAVQARKRSQTSAVSLAIEKNRKSILLEYLSGKQTFEAAASFLLAYFQMTADSEVFSLGFIRTRTAAASDWLEQQLTGLFPESLRPVPLLLRDQLILVFSAPEARYRPYLQQLLDMAPANASAACLLSAPMFFRALPDCFQLLNGNIYAFFYAPRGQISALDTVHLLASSSMNSSVFSVSAEPCLQAVCQTDSDALGRYLNGLYQQILSQKVNPDLVIAQLAELYADVHDALQNKLTVREPASFPDILGRLQQAFSFEELWDEYRRSLFALRDALETPHEESADQFRKIVQYILEHSAEDLSLNDLSDQFHLNPAYLSSLFSKNVGVTFVSYIRNVRMKKAEEYLVQTDWRISAIASAVGYPNYRYFCKLFRETYGMIPRQYRDMNRTEDAKQQHDGEGR